MISQLYPNVIHWSKVGTIWIISDTHFGDEDLKKEYPNRPSDDELVKLINSKVGKKDTLIILGDIGEVEYVKKLRGYKVLIMGNHDRGKSVYNDAFDEIYSGPLIITSKLVLSHEPVNYDGLFNIHGHRHNINKTPADGVHMNVCLDACGYQVLNFNQFMKSGAMSKVKTIHRQTIDKATEKKKKKKTLKK